MFNVGVFAVFILAGLFTGVASAITLMEARWLPVVAYVLSVGVGVVGFVWYAFASMRWQ